MGTIFDKKKKIIIYFTWNVVKNIKIIKFEQILYKVQNRGGEMIGKKIIYFDSKRSKK